MIILAFDYNNNRTYLLKFNSGKISDKFIQLYDDFDKEINNVKSISIDFNSMIENCAIKVTLIDDSELILTAIGIEMINKPKTGESNE